MWSSMSVDLSMERAALEVRIGFSVSGKGVESFTAFA